MAHDIFRGTVNVPENPAHCGNHFHTGRCRGGGYKYGPTVWHKVEDKTGIKTEAKAGTSASGSTAMNQTITTNAAGIKLSNCDLGMVNLTNHYETCVLLGPGTRLPAHSKRD